MKFGLRPWHLSDLDSLVRYANNAAIAANMTDQFPHPYTADNARAFIGFTTKDDPVHIFCIEVEGEAAGGIGIHPQADIYRKNAELGYWLAEPWWGKGIITAAVKQVVDFAFHTYEIDRVFARPFGTNTASQKVLEKAGFILEARLAHTIFKNGEYLDELIYAVRREDWLSKENVL
jgi:RimJ/RimL family protein N-acetyltransferase